PKKEATHKEKIEKKEKPEAKTVAKEEKKAKTKEKTEEKTKKEVKGGKQEKVKQTAAKVKEVQKTPPKPKDKDKVDKETAVVSKHEQKDTTGPGIRNPGYYGQSAMWQIGSCTNLRTIPRLTSHLTCEKMCFNLNN
uniref:Uncharacterized protein n=1 Tax=Loxodonta africana TaxID=9785 RepID=G3SZS8_LOXAF